MSMPFRRSPRPLDVAVVRRDALFTIELPGAPLGEVWGTQGTRAGTYSAGPTEVWKVWKANQSMHLLVADAVREVRALGAQVMHLQCVGPLEVVFRGEKSLASGEIGEVQVQGRGAEVVATIRVGLIVGAFPFRLGESPTGRRHHARPRIQGDCPPGLISVLDEQADYELGG